MRVLTTDNVEQAGEGAVQGAGMQQGAAGAPVDVLHDAVAGEAVAGPGQHRLVGTGMAQRAGVHGQALRAIARAGGWIAHCFEQLETGRLIRPQSKYVGKVMNSVR